MLQNSEVCEIEWIVIIVKWLKISISYTIVFILSSSQLSKRLTELFQYFIMTSLKLSNRLINGKFENLCYVNSTLNLLHSNKDFASFFKDKKYLELDQDPLNFPISSEISKLFNSQDGGVKSDWQIYWHRTVELSVCSRLLDMSLQAWR